MQPGPGFDPLAGQGEGQFFFPSQSTLVLQTCLRLTPFVCTARTQMCVHAKDPTSIHPSIHLSIHLSIYLLFVVSIYLSLVSIYLSIYLSVALI